MTHRTRPAAFHSTPDALAPPWPDLVIGGGTGAVPAMLAIRRRSDDRTRLVQIGNPLVDLARFDLVVATPLTRLPIRANVVQVTAPLAGLPADQLARAGRLWGERLQDLPRPWTAVFVGPGRDGYRIDAKSARLMGELVSEQAQAAGGGCILVRTDPETPEPARQALLDALQLPYHEIVAGRSGADDAHTGFLTLADRLVVTGDDVQTLAEACLASKPTAFFPLPRRTDPLPLGRALRQLLRLMVGGGTSYRGTPHQQHGLSRWIDSLAARGRVALPHDVEAFHRALLARGLATRLDAPATIARPKPLDDLQRVTERVREMMGEGR